MLRYSQACIDLVKRCEDEAGALTGKCTHLKAYRCPSGVWTCGWGTTKGVGPDTVFTQEEADRRLIEDLDDAWAIVEKWVKVLLAQGPVDALTSFVQNVGPGRPRPLGKLTGGKDGFVWLAKRDPNGSPRHSTLLKKVNAQDSTAADEFPKWIYSAGRPLDGLRKRRGEERDLFRS